MFFLSIYRQQQASLHPQSQSPSHLRRSREESLRLATDRVSLLRAWSTTCFRRSELPPPTPPTPRRCLPHRPPEPAPDSPGCLLSSRSLQRMSRVPSRGPVTVITVKLAPSRSISPNPFQSRLDRPLGEVRRPRPGESGSPGSWPRT